MTVPPIVIAGASLGGLTLGRCLLSKGISTIIIDQASPSSRRCDYSMELYGWAYKPLLGFLNLDEVTFCEKLSEPSAAGKQIFPLSSWHVETLIGEGLDVRWGNTISGVASGTQTITIRLDDKSQIETKSLIAADGVHSSVRQSLVPSAKPNVYSYVVFSGTRRISCEHFQEAIAPQMKEHTILQARYDDVLLQTFINSSTSTDVGLGYTYSRPAREDDPLHHPDRPTRGAKDIPEAFYVELDSLKDLNGAFREVFELSKVRQDRLLHWLMRSILPSQEAVSHLADQGVLLIGDAVHAMPILGSMGGNMAIKDGIELADWIAANGTLDLGVFVASKYKEWKTGVEKGVKRLEDMHGGKSALL